MRVTAIRELSVPLAGRLANARVSFTDHTVSLVAVVSDVVRDGKRVAGVAFNSIGRYAQGGLLRERFIPRILEAAPESLLDASGQRFDPASILEVALRNEKPGGHGDRAAAVGALELAFWDLNAKLGDEPAHATIARHFRRPFGPARVRVYAAGGYYYPGGKARSLRDELAGYADLGFDTFKIKVGGAPLAEDLARVEEALEVAGAGERLAVDANGRFDLDAALDYATALQPYGLRWLEEAGDPLDFELNRRVSEAYMGALATGENLFSASDVRNLVRFGGMRPALDVFQMDPGLSYGLVEYGRMLEVLEGAGFDRRFAHPHGGHLVNLHVAVGLGLGGCEAYPGVFQPFGGYGEGCEIDAGFVTPSAAPGFGLEQKRELAPYLDRLLA